MAKAKTEQETVAIELPVAPELAPEIYAPRQVQIAGLSAAQAAGLKRLRIGLERSGAKLDNGKPVASAADAIRFALERIAMT